MDHARLLGGCLSVWLAVAACAGGEDASPTPVDSGSDADDGGTDSAAGAAGASGAGGSAGSGGTGGGQDGGADADAADAAEEPPVTCGNGTLDPGEACEGSDFGGKTCASIGLGSGQLLCNAYCSIVATNCVPLEQCGDGKDNDDDGLFDCDDTADCETSTACTDPCSKAELAVVPGFDYGDTTGKPAKLVPSCNPTSGSEAIYQVTAPITGKMKISSQGGAKLSLSVRTDCADAASEIACTLLAGNGELTSLGVDIVQGQKLFVIVDEPGSSPGAWFDLTFDLVQPESGKDCGNFVDDDVDEFVDCDDPQNCQTSPECAPGAGPTGSACAVANQCSATGNDPLCLPDPQWPGGYCSEFCTAASPCATGALCFDLGLSKNGVCLDACVTAADCRAGFDCVDKGLSQKVCFLPSEWKCGDFIDNDGDQLVDCEDADKCQTLPACLTGPNPVGTTCSLANECQANAKDPICLLNQNFLQFSDGYCSEFCNLSANDCSGGGYCSNLLGLASGNGVCLDPCASFNDCRPGYSCEPTGTGISACVPFGVTP